MNFQDIPVIFEVFQGENLTPKDSPIEGDKIICEDSSGNKYLIKDCRGIERKMFEEVFPVIEAQQLSFSTLEFPKFRNAVTKTYTDNGVIKTRDFIFLNYYTGTTFNEDWNETSAHAYGGRALDVSFAEKAKSLLRDFALIDIAQLAQFNLPTFDFAIWKESIFPLLSTSLVQHNSLTPNHINNALSILSVASLFQHSQKIITNGDFYPRNFIELSSGKIVVIDWEGRQREHVRVNGETHGFASQRNAFINYIENHVAFFFVHMWGNHAVQKRFIKEAAQMFNLTPENLQAALLIKSLEQGAAFNGGFLSLRESEIFTHALNIDYINDLIQ